MGSSKRRVVVTGVGVVAPNGIGKDAFWDSLSKGISGIKTITSFDPTNFPCHVAGEIRDFDAEKFIDPKKARRLDRFVQLGLAATSNAISDSKLTLSSLNTSKAGVAAGTATAGQGWVFEQYEIFRSKGYKRLNPFTAASTFPNALSATLSIEYGLTGPSSTFSSGCSSGAEAIGFATNLIKSGRVNLMIVNSAEALLYPPIFGSYCATRLLTEHNEEPISTPKPFDKNRDGIALAEAAGTLILEDYESAIARGAHIYAEITGYGETCDAYHAIAQDETGEQLSNAIQIALKEAKLKPSDINYIKLHGTGDKNGDKIESTAVNRVFGDDAKNIPMSSIKSMIGHSQGGCATVETVACLLAMENSMVPPTINFDTPDPECNLNLCTNKAQKATISNALVNTFGFGGKNVAIVVSKPT